MNNETATNYLATNKKKVFLLIVIIVLVVLGLIFLAASCKKSAKQVKQTSSELTTSAPETSNSQPVKPKIIKTPLGEFNAEKPEKTMPLPPEKVEEVSKKEEVIKITISPSGFSPNEFTVEADKTVSLLIKAEGSDYTLKFRDPEMANIIVGLSLGETRGISFIAPTKKGDYVFIRERPGFEGEPNPATGVMHVR
jgi:heme/copper-type cytochrome/quinol oxidase subunit 2